MSKRKQWIERGKSVLIVLLLISAVLLLRESAYYSSLQERLGNSAGGNTGGSAADAVGESTGARTSPVTLLVSTTEGTRYAAAWDKTGVAAMFENFSAALGEALGSAVAPEAVTTAQWQQALTGDAVYFDFSCAHPLPLLASWLGTTASFDTPYDARLLCLHCDGEAVELYFLNAADSSYYRCTTAVSAAALRSKMENYRRTNAFFAFENAKLRGLAADTVVLETLPQLHHISGTGAVDQGFDLEALFDVLGMNTAAVKQYTESDGTEVYLENGRTVRIDARGLISCKSGTAAGTEPMGDERVTAVAVADDFVRRVMSSLGAEELRFAGLETYGDGGYLIRYEYSVNGVAVQLPGELSAAVVTVKRGVVTQAELCPRIYTEQEETVQLLPMLLSAAAATAEGSEQLQLLYLDNGFGVSCAWVR